MLRHVQEKGERHEKPPTQKRNSVTPNPSPLASPETRPKRSEIIGSPDPKEKPCIICNQVKCHENIKIYRIGSKDMANSLLKAASFDTDDVFTRVIPLKKPGDVYAADLRYHANCFQKYVKTF